MKEDEAARVIQKCFREYLERAQRNVKLASNSQVDHNINKLGDDEKLQVKKVLEEVNLFYKKLHFNLKKKGEIRKLCNNIDEVSKNLKAITKLEQCKELELSFSDSGIMEKMKEKHQEQIRQINLKWWEKLDSCDNV